MSRRDWSCGDVVCSTNKKDERIKPPKMLCPALPSHPLCMVNGQWISLWNRRLLLCLLSRVLPSHGAKGEHSFYSSLPPSSTLFPLPSLTRIYFFHSFPVSTKSNGQCFVLVLFRLRSRTSTSASTTQRTFLFTRV